MEGIDITDIVIDLSGVDIKSFYGDFDVNIKYIKSKFNNLRITPRGESIYVSGDREVLYNFEKSFGDLVEYFERYGHISNIVIDQTFDIPQGLSTKKSSAAASAEEDDVILYGGKGNIIKARTENQKKMVKQAKSNDLLFAIGPAGSGKTYVAIALAVRALKARVVKRIILTRPAVEAGEKLGFLPGDMKEKLDPYLQPLYDALFDMMPQKKLAEYMDQGVIQIAPLAFMRGRTLDDAFVILDEAQNSTLPQLKMFLTRMGRNAKFVVTGDASQVDLPKRSDSGLMKTINIISSIESVAVIEMTGDDIVRHRLVKEIVAAYDKNNLVK